VATRIAADLEPIPGYRLIERIGRGGFGEVWKAEAPGGMLKAIKFVYGDLDEATEDGKPAEQELKSLHRVKSIRHPYILSLERFDIVDGQLLIVMELADRNLYDRFRECQQQGLIGIPREELIDYMEESAEALDLMNSNFQLQHLDIKPQNLFLVFNHIKVADFGLAKDMEGMQASLTGGVTPVYAAPETFECKVTRYCDQYSLGIVYQELLTGQRPFNGTTARQLMMQHIHSEPDLTPLPEADRPVIGRVLSKKPEQRFGTCAEFVQLLRDAGRPAPTIVTGVPAPDGLPPLARSTPVGSIANAPLVTPSRNLGDGAGVTARNGPANLPTVAERAKLPSLMGMRPSAANALLANAKPAAEEKTGPGCLFPSLVIGLGEMGAIVLQRLRRTLRDRFGTSSLPHLRFMLVDTDPDTIQAAGSLSAPLESNEVFLARMRKSSHYSKSRDDLPNIASWLNPQLLFRIPRHPSTAGTRSFGRLALCDHYRALTQKIRAELESILPEANLAEADKKTGLGLRSTWPRVYVVTSLVGGTGSGMFLDLAYAVRFQMKLLGYKQPEVNGVLYVPNVDRTTSKNAPVANAYAALTELYHYTSPNTVYEALFDTAVGPIIDRERPFTRCLILPLPKTAEPAETRTALGLGAGFLHHELLTPFGRIADQARTSFTKPSGLPSFFQTCGTFRLTWPRRTMLERLSLRLGERVVQVWAATSADHLIEPIRTWLDEQWANQQLNADQLFAQFKSACQEEMRQDPGAAFDAILDPWDERNRRAGLDANETCSAMEKLLQIVGKPELEGQPPQTGTLGQILEQSCKSLGSQGEKKIAGMAASLIEVPAYRFAAADEAISQLTMRIRSLLESVQPTVLQRRQESADLFFKLLGNIGQLESMSRSSRRRGMVREIIADLRVYGRKQLEYQMIRAVATVYRSMLNHAPELTRDVQLSRTRLDDIVTRLIETNNAQDKQGYLGPCKVVLPAGCASIAEAAERLVADLSPQDLLELDTRLQKRIESQFKSLFNYCLEKTDHSKAMTKLILYEGRHYLDKRLEGGNAAAIFFESTEQEQAAHRDIMQAYDEAVPELLKDRPRQEGQMCILSVPGDENGARFGRLAEQMLHDARVIVGTGTDDIVFHREQLYLSPNELPQLGPVAREAYIQVTHQDQIAPHSRNDVNWIPAGKDSPS
jgi:eukaryotic-like serine/threonine-protein kinase